MLRSKRAVILKCGAEDKAFDYMIHIYSENTEKREGEDVLPEVHHRQDVLSAEEKTAAIYFSYLNKY